MTETLAEKADRDTYREAFWEAVWAVNYWTAGGPEPLITLDGRPCTVDVIITISSIAGFLTDDMPGDICSTLESMAYNLGIVLKDRSYASGAGCLSQAYEARKAKFAKTSQKPPRLSGSQSAA